MNRSQAAKPAFSPRDRRLMLAFALFAEALLAYMLLVDQPLGKIGKAREIRETTHAAYETLRQAVGSERPGSREPSELSVPFLIPEPGETSSLAIQQALGQRASEAGARLKTVQIEPEAVKEAGLLRYGVVLSLEGPYEAIAAFIRQFESPRHVMRVETVALSAAAAGSDVAEAELLQARLSLSFYFLRP